MQGWTNDLQCGTEKKKRIMEPWGSYDCGEEVLIRKAGWRSRGNGVSRAAGGGGIGLQPEDKAADMQGRGCRLASRGLG